MSNGKNLDSFIREFEDSNAGKSRIRKLQVEKDEMAKAIALVASHRSRVNIPLPTKDNTIQFAVIGDTHFGSLYERIDDLRAFYEAAKARGITEVFHSGDVIDGWKMYAGQEFELHARGWAEQRDWFVKKAPKVAGMTTHFITGNHDGSMKKLAGLDVGPELADRRPDWKFIGERQGRIILTTESGLNYEVMLIHPDGGTAYALSYKSQRIVEQIEGGKKPNMICIGHFHKADNMPSYRNVAALQVGTFQAQTPLMMGKGLSAHVGGWFVRVTVGSRRSLCNRIETEFVALYG